MKLAYWMYAGPAHIGTLRVASSFKNVHAIMHAPLGDDYFNVMRSMLERERDFTPVTASIVDRHVLARGSQNKVVENIVRKDKEEKPDLIILTPTCTSSILQEDLQNFVERAALESKCDLLLADVNHYRVNELQAADRTLEQVVRFYIEKAKKQGQLKQIKTKQISANIIGIFTLGFHNQHDCRELEKLLNDLGIAVNLIIPENGSVSELHKLPQAWFNIVPYREYGLMAGNYLLKEFDMPLISTTPMGIVDTAIFIREIADVITKLLSTKSVNKEVTSDCSQQIPSRPEDLHSVEIAPPAGSHTEVASVVLPKRTTESKKQLLDSSTFEKQVANKGAHFDLQRISKGSASGSLDSANLSLPSLPSFREEQEEELAAKACMTIDFEEYIDKQSRFVSQAAWFSRSIDCQNLTGKKTVVFGDSTHAASMTRILAREMGVRVSCAGTYCKQDADWFREQVQAFCDSVLITDDHTQVADMIARIEPAAIFGTQMERHIGKRLDIPCGVISSPVHIQNFSLGYRPFLGYEGANQIADLVYNSFTLGMEDHLLEIFGGHDTKQVITKELSNQTDLNWAPEALTELKKIPGFVRGRIKRNTEKFARDQKVNSITVSVMYAAKEAAGA